MSQTNHLDDDQRQQLYAMTREEYARHDRRVGRVRACKAAVKERLTAIGWEDILIQLAIAIAAKLIVDWIKGKVSEPPASMPVAFATGPVEDVGDEDPDTD